MNGKNKCIIKDMRKLRKRSIEMFYFAALPINPYKKHLKANKSRFHADREMINDLIEGL